MNIEQTFARYTRVIADQPEPGKPRSTTLDLNLLKADVTASDRVLDLLHIDIAGYKPHLLATLETSDSFVGLLAHRLGIGYLTTYAKGVTRTPTHSHGELEMDAGPLLEARQTLKLPPTEPLRIVYVGDILKHGITTADAIKLLKSANAKVVHVACLIEGLPGNGRQTIEQLGASVSSLVTFTDDGTFGPGISISQGLAEGGKRAAGMAGTRSKRRHHNESPAANNLGGEPHRHQVRSLAVQHQPQRLIS